MVLQVWVEEERAPGRVTRRARFETAAGPAPEPLWFRIEGEILPPPLELLDAFAIAFLFKAMRDGTPLRLHGPVSRRLLQNLEEFQAAWHCWRPQDYHPIEILADREVDLEPGEDGSAVVAFSGGADSMFSLWRHYRAQAGRGSRRLAAAIMIHGFDIPLPDEAGFALAQASARAALETLDLPLVTVKTNWRSLLCATWVYEVGTALGASLAQYQGLTTAGILAADGSYDHLLVPWGSNAITNRLLSGGDFEVIDDGTAYKRTETLVGIRDWPAGLANLRVCWAGARVGANCGVCEKCIRTQLSFRSAGLPVPPAFDSPAGLLDICRLGGVYYPQLSSLIHIWREGRVNGIREPWMWALAFTIAKNHCLGPFHPALRGLRQRLARVAWLRALYRQLHGRPRPSAYG
jgi:hypothetical protein